MKPSELRGEPLRVWEMWVRLGLSESAAMTQLYNDGLLPREPGDELVETFRSLGLSEGAARVAAGGRSGTHGAVTATSTAVALSEALSALEGVWVRFYGASPASASMTAKAAARQAWGAAQGSDEMREAATVRELGRQARMLEYWSDKPWPGDDLAGRTAAPSRRIFETRSSSSSKPARRNITGD